MSRQRSKVQRRPPRRILGLQPSTSRQQVLDDPLLPAAGSQMQRRLSARVRDVRVDGAREQILRDALVPAAHCEVEGRSAHAILCGGVDEHARLEFEDELYDRALAVLRRHVERRLAALCAGGRGFGFQDGLRRWGKGMG